MHIYNLEFPSRCPRFSVAGYCFNRVEKYAERIHQIDQTVNHVSEFRITAKSGYHAHTADVTLPTPPLRSVLAWQGEEDALADILLVLSVFTKRSVFGIDPELQRDDPLLTGKDPRAAYWGGILRCSLVYEASDKASLNPYDIGFEKQLNQIYDRIRTEEWLDTYKKGYFLFLYQSAIWQRFTDGAFLQCWTIWEHLFAILNNSSMSDHQIRSCHSNEKIAFILTKYAFRKELTDKEKDRLKELANIRNRLIHYGQFPSKDLPKEIANATTFIRLTEFVVARVLGLAPSNVFNTLEQLEAFLVKPP